MAAVDGGTGSEGLTVEQSASVFEGFLSDEEDKETPETPPAQESPEPAQPADAEASNEPAEAEGESPQTDETGETPETPASNAVDPSMKVKTKVDGQEIEVTLEEALKGYSRTQDYTRKTQALAERARAFEAEAAAVRSERAENAQYLTTLRQAIDEVTPREPDWAKLQQEQPNEFAVQWAQWDQHKRERAALHQQELEAHHLVQQDNARLRQATIETERAKLLEAIPEWKDDAVARAEKAKLVAFALQLGYSEEDLGKVDDHRALLLLRETMLWRESQAKRPGLQAKIERVTTAKPGSAGTERTPVSDKTRALQRLAKTGDKKAAAAFFESIL